MRALINWYAFTINCTMRSHSFIVWVYSWRLTCLTNFSLPLFLFYLGINHSHQQLPFLGIQSLTYINRLIQHIFIYEIKCQKGPSFTYLFVHSWCLLSIWEEIEVCFHVFLVKWMNWKHNFMKWSKRNLCIGMNKNDHQVFSSRNNNNSL